MAGEVVHVELNTPDLEKAKAFYGGLFGWQFKDMDMGEFGTYSTFMPGATGPGGGMMSMPAAPTMWLNYIGVEDLKAATAKAKELGATVMRENMEVPNMGWFTIMQDPNGATIAMWQAK